MSTTRIYKAEQSIVILHLTFALPVLLNAIETLGLEYTDENNLYIKLKI